jgi:hypothetical protein
VRVDGIYDLASWLLSGAKSHQNWDPEAIANAVRDGDQKKIKLSKAVPVAWVYLDAWESADGVVHFAPDVYNLDGAGDEMKMKPRSGAVMVLKENREKPPSHLFRGARPPRAHKSRVGSLHKHFSSR